MKLTLVVPCFNEEGNVEAFYNKATEDFSGCGYDYEFIFIDDGSKDKTYQKLKALHSEKDAHIKVIRFSRNFGKESAIYAGLENASGDYISIIDADLQQEPSIVRNMVSILDEDDDLDCVTAYQENRHESGFIKHCKKRFYKIINSVSDTEFVSNASDFRTFRKSVADAILELKEYYRFSKGLFSWVGFNTKYIPYEAKERNAGESKWGFSKLLKYAFEGIVAFTTLPLRISTVLGVTISCLSVIYLIVVLIQKIFFSIVVPGYATIVVLILLIGGLNLFCMGMISEYLSRMYIQGKKRPIYLAKTILDDKKENKD